MSKKIIFITITMLLVSVFTYAQGHGPMDRKMLKHAGFRIMMVEKNLLPANVLLKFKDEIGLTPDQVNKITKMQDGFRETTIKKQADLKISELKLESYMKGDKINRAKMENMIRDIGKMKTDSQIEHINYLLDLKDVLTPEQLKKIDEFKKNRMNDRMKMRGERRWDERRRDDRPMDQPN
jgi:Spy/CpxP family protein refolding chaperone